MAELNADLVPPSAGAVPVPASDKRARTLTSKGQEQYDKHLLRMKDKYDHTWREIERIMYSVDDENSDFRYLRDIDDSVRKLYSNLLIDSNVITEFLENQRTEPAFHDMVAHMNNNARRTDLVRRFRSRIEDMLLSEAESYSERLETKSVASLSASSSVARKQMNASMKKAELAFLDKEVELQKQRLELQKQTVDIELKALQQRKMSALADAEVKVIESYEPDDYGKDDFESQRSLRRIKQERVVDFVSNSQCNIGNNVDNVSRSYPKLVPNAGAPSSPGSKAWAADHELSVSSIPPPILNPNSSVFRPGSCAPYIPYHDNQTSVVQDISKYLLKKELLMVGFSAFDDTAQHFNVWRGAFINIVREIQATPLEELDLLTKWLGPDSRNFAISIRATNLSDPERGLTLIWKRLRDLYGRPEIREAALKRRLNDIPKLTDNDRKQYYKLVDVLTEIDSAKCDEQFKTLLSYYDSSAGVLPIVAKLPRGIQESWCVRASQYKAQNNAPFPPFSFFLRFVREVCERKNDPSLDVSEFGNRGPSESEPKRKTFNHKLTACKSEIVSSELSDVNDNSNNFLSKRCPIHHANHALTGCRSFLAMPLEKRRDYLKNNDLCFRCCVGKHRASKCQDNEIKCGKCLSNQHITCMHYDRPKSDSRPEHGGESATPSHQSSGEKAINTKCSELCGDSVGGRSCGKIVLVKVYQANDPKLAIRTYAIIDDQSNKTLARSKFFDTFHVNGETSVFTMSSCSGSLSYSGRTANNFIVEPICGSAQLCLSTIIECDDIPNNVQEIPTPEVAIAYPHLTEIAADIPDLDPMSEILLLIGRDVPPAHHVIEQKVGPKNGPFAQRLVLGWTIIGDVCLGGIHKPSRINVMKTNVLGNGRNSVCRPCDSQLTVSRVEQMELPSTSRHTGSTLACDIFKTTHFDETPSFSTEDRQFLALMNDEMEQNKDGKWTAPLPFRNDRPRLPNNRSHALKRAIMFDQNLQKNPTKQYHAVEFMQNIFQRGHAELAPPLSAEEECWYLPIFGVYHPHKLDKIRMVFDSSAKYHDMSLNSALLTGPDLTNSLMGVLMRFRIGPVAVTADIEQMFHCFAVSEKHRNFLRFLWYKDNDPQKPLTEYRMCVHVFGNSPSPAVATYGLRRAVLEAEPRFGSDVRGFIDKNFYVDDGLISLSSADQVVDLLHRTKEALRTHGQLRLHKFASNDPVVMQSFEPQDLAKDIVNVDLGREELPTQGSLGLVWDLQLDSFTFRLNPEEKPFTRRGVLSQVNSLYDPLGFVAPIIVQGKLLLREMMVPPSVSWDEPLPEVFLSRWTCWKEALSQLLDLHIPRHYLPFQRSAEQSVIIFTDASEVAIAAVAYLSVKDENGNVYLGFLLGKAKVAPKQATSIPRLELCAAALGVEMAVVIRDQLEIPPDKFFFFTDSMIVMGYIHNTSRRFLTYVANRVHRIIAFSSPDQWNFVPTGVNPADHGTRSTPGFVMSDVWLRGPIEWLSKWRATEAESAATNFSLIHPDDDREIKREIVVNKISTSKATFSTHRFQNFSSWQSLIRGLMFLKRKSRCVKDPRHKASLTDVALFLETETFVIQVVQTEVFSREFACLKEGKPIPRDSRIINLDPWIDVDGILRVGGRIKNANVSLQEKTPIIIPGFHHIARLIVLRQHQLVRHQGRHLTEGAVRAAGFWITGCKRLVYSIISNCVKCRRSRGTLSVQKMCDLPAERLTPSPPFTYVGVDCFGPWEVVTRRTRGGSADSKRWAVLFTCMCSRAVHIEVLEQMSTPSFINALRRFFGIRGKVKEFFSDRGSNFIGCVRELGITGVNVEDSQIRTYLQTSGSVWKFNTPYSSHMGGAWERLIGITRRILNVLLLDARYLKLTHEVLTTFLAEVCSIINNRPIVPVSSDSDSPFILTPNVLLTQKSVDVTEVPMDVNVRSLYTSQWKVVQALADRFWTRWRQEYLQTLQPRKKWEVQSPNVNVGDIVLLKDSDVHRNHWPLGRISRVFPSKDSLIRKVELFVMRDGTKHFYIRPITQIVLLLSV